MAKKAERSLRLSTQGIEKAKTALTKFGSVADLAAQIGAARTKKRGASSKTTVGMSRGTIYNFLKGEPVQRKEFHEICKKLGLKWQEIVDLPGINQPEPAEKEQEQGTDIDELVQEVRSRLRNDIERLHGRIPLYGVDGLVPLGDLFVNVNILEQRSSSRRAERDDLWEDFLSGRQDAYGYRSFDRMGLGRNLKCVAGDKVLEKDNNLMVVGKPGSGKTTYLQHIVIKCNDGLLQPHRIPVLIKLRDFVKDGQRFEYCLKDYLCWQWQLSEDNTERLLKDGKALIALDGLDEVTGADGQAIAEQIEYFARTYPQNQLVVTSRTQPQELGFGYFEYVEIDNFNQEQVKDFASRWFEAITYNTQEGQEKAKQFLDQLYLQENHQIRELAITPILLSLTCSVFYYRSKFYSQRSKLYQEAIELLLERWDKNRKIERDEIYRELSPERKQQLLCYLAATNFTKPKYYILFEQDEIEDYIASYLNCSRQDSKDVLMAMEKQHGLLIERAQGHWSFSHLTFQEYFAAKWFCDSSDWEGLVSQIRGKHWREVFLLTVELIPTADNAHELLNLMKEMIDNLIASDDMLQQLLIEVNQKARFIKAAYKKPAMRAFYIALTLEFPYALAIKLKFNLRFEEDITCDLQLDHTLFSTLGWALKIEEGLVHARAMNKMLETALDIQSTRIRALETAYVNAINSAANVNKTYIALAQPPIKVIKLAFYIWYNQELKLRDELQKLKAQLPDRSEENRENFERWWKDSRVSWLTRLIDVIIKYRNLSQCWEIDQKKKELFYDYYDANKLLVDCLNSGCAVSDEVREHIEETLLLPIA